MQYHNSGVNFLCPELVFSTRSEEIDMHAIVAAILLRDRIVAIEFTQTAQSVVNNAVVVC